MEKRARIASFETGKLVKAHHMQKLYKEMHVKRKTIKKEKPLWIQTLKCR
jgi:hypothetical protein